MSIYRDKRLLAGLILVILYTLGGFFLLPRILHWQLLNRLPELLERPVSLEKTAFNPFTLTLRLEGFDVRELDGGDFMGFEALRVNLQSSSLVRKGVVLKEVQLTAPRFSVHRDADNRFNFEHLLARGESVPGEDAAAAAAPAKMPALRIKRLSVENGVVDFSDIYPGSPFSKGVRDLDFAVDDFTTLPGEAGEFRFEAASGPAESIILSGKLGLNPVLLGGRIEVRGLELGDFMPYLEGWVDAVVHGGRLTAGFAYEVALADAGIEARVTDGSLAIEGFNLLAGAAGEPLAGWQALTIEGFGADLSARQLSVDRIGLGGGHLMAHRREDGSLNLEALIPRIASAGSAAGPGGVAAPGDSLQPWGVRVNEIAVADFSLLLLDESLPQPADINLTVPEARLSGLTNARGGAFGVTARIRNQPAGDARIEGQAALNPLAADLRITIDAWDLVAAGAYLSRLADAQLRSGALSVKLQTRAELDASGAAAFSMRGDASLADIELREPEGDGLLGGWNSLAFTGIDFAWPAMRLEVGAIEHLAPRAEFVVHEDGATTLSRVMRFQDKPQDEDAPAAVDTSPRPDVPEGAAGPLQVHIGTVRMADGKFAFRDQRQTPAVALTVEGFSLRAEGLSSDRAARPRLDIEARLMGTAPLSVRGSLGLLAPEPFADLEIAMQGLELTPLGPYFSRYVGFALERGQLEFDLDYRIEANQLQAENLLRVGQLALGAPSGSPDATGLPVRLAIALLKDPAGNIKVDLPIRGNLDDPQFRIGRVVVTALTNLIARAATAPFSLLAGLVGSSPEDLERVLFQPGDSALSPAARSGLDALARAMTERPGIAVAIRAAIDAEVETAPLQRQLLRDVLAERLRIAPGQSAEAAYRQRVERAYSLQVQPAEGGADAASATPTFEEMEAVLLSAIPMGEPQLEELAARRRQAVHAYLTAKPGIAPERVIIEKADALQRVETRASEVRMEIR
jgi:hypothetical protein